MKVANEQMEEALRQKEEREASQTQEPTKPKQGKTSRQKIKVDPSAEIPQMISGKMLARQRFTQVVTEYQEEAQRLAEMLPQAISIIDSNLGIGDFKKALPAKIGEAEQEGGDSDLDEFTLQSLFGGLDDDAA